MSAPREIVAASLAPDVDKNNLVKFLSYVKGAGTPEDTETVPEFIGQEYYDTSEEQFWKATSLETWTLITPAAE